MLKFLLLMVFALAARAEVLDPVLDQIAVFKKNTKGPIGIMTTAAGAPIESRQARSSLNTVLLSNEFLIQGLAQIARERIPVRSVHPKGSGAFGYFVTTRDMSHITKADFLCGVGKVTPIAARLSMGATERGGSDLTREPRGFAVKFYTTEGNFDIPGFNTPVFTFKEPSLFVAFAHVMRTNPRFDLKDVNMVWDFITLHPESLNIFLLVFSDKGIPDGYRNMEGFGVHTWPVYNAAGKLHFVRFHFYPKNGVKTLNSTIAAQLGANDPDYCARDLYSAIAAGDYPTWKVYVQIMTEKDLHNSTLNMFDVSVRVPIAQYPLVEIGEMVLNRNPQNYFADVEQMAFCPSNLVPGILGGPDKTFESRRFSYRDAARHRLGVNFDNIPVNFPYRSKLHKYNRDGVAPVKENGLGSPSYYPNSFHGPVPYVDEMRPREPTIYEAEANNIDQCREFYQNEILCDERLRLAENIVTNLCGAVNELQDRALQLLRKVHHDLADNVANGLLEKNCRD